MLTLKKIAVTGGIATGKSTVCRLLKELGAFVISADEIVHQLLSPNTDLGKRVISLLGPSVVEGEVFSRKAIARKVFRDPILLKHLEQLIHPEVQRFIEIRYSEIAQTSKYSLFVVEVPLLFESGQDTFYDAIIVVAANEEICRKRFNTKTPYDAEEFSRRSERLISQSEKKQRADFILENNGTLSELKHEVIQLYNQLTRR